MEEYLYIHDSRTMVLMKEYLSIMIRKMELMEEFWSIHDSRTMELMEEYLSIYD